VVCLSHRRKVCRKALIFCSTLDRLGQDVNTMQVRSDVRPVPTAQTVTAAAFKSNQLKVEDHYANSPEGMERVDSHIYSTAEKRSTHVYIHTLHHSGWSQPMRL
jgi:S-adenosylmethionine synthetase